MLSTEDLAAIRAIVHEELARAKRRPRVHRASAIDPWLAALRAGLPGVSTRLDASGRAYLTPGDALAHVGAAMTPLALLRAAHALAALGYQRGPRVRTAGRLGARVTPYYPPPGVDTPSAP